MLKFLKRFFGLKMLLSSEWRKGLISFPVRDDMFLNMTPTHVIADSVPRSVLNINAKTCPLSKGESQREGLDLIKIKKLLLLLFPSSKSKISVLPQVEDMK